MFIARYIASRIAKLTGNSLKVACYPFHWLFPRKRFALPHARDPLWPPRGTHKIPRTLWQTNFTDRVTLPVYLNYLFNRMMAPTYAYRFMSDAESTAFIAGNYSKEVADDYEKLQIGAARADFWRILVLQKFGGVYLDIDAHIVWPLGFIIPRDATELYIVGRDADLTNYFLASAPHNPHLEWVIASIQDRIRKRQSNSVFELTGPKVIDDLGRITKLPSLSYKVTCYQGSFTNEYFQYVDHPRGKWFREQQDHRSGENVISNVQGDCMSRSQAPSPNL